MLTMLTRLLVDTLKLDRGRKIALNSVYLDYFIDWNFYALLQQTPTVIKTAMSVPAILITVTFCVSAPVLIILIPTLLY